MLKPFWDQQSGKQYRLRADSYAELLRRAKFSVAAVLPTGLENVPAWSYPAWSAPASFSPPLHHPLAPMSANVVWVADCENDGHVGLANSHSTLLPCYTSDNAQGDPKSTKWTCFTSPGYTLSVLASGALGLYY